MGLDSPHPDSSHSLAADPPPPGEGKTRVRSAGKARKPSLDEMGPGPAKESQPYRPGGAADRPGGARPRSTAGKGGTRAWRGRRR